MELPVVAFPDVPKSPVAARVSDWREIPSSVKMVTDPMIAAAVVAPAAV